MHATIARPLDDTAAGATAEAVLRACVHCGMCNAVCPTFALAGDERDGPRGRIYLIKALLEGESAGAATRRHLDRCLSCRACETACPSGVEYHRLYDIGRGRLAQVAPRPWPGRLVRAAVRWLAHHPAILGPLLRLAHEAHPPFPLLGKEDRRRTAARRMGPPGRPAMLLLGGCVQRGAAPHINAATTRVFARVGLALDERPGCCGAIDAHLEAFAAGRARAKRNIAIWEAALNAGAEAIVVNASGCAAFIRDYPDLLADEPQWRDRARRVAAAIRDPVEILEAGGLAAAREPARPRIAVHDPCTLANGPALGGRVARLLATLGYQPTQVADAPRCCGSAGAGSLFHPGWSGALRRRMLDTLLTGAPAQIVTANIGCWLHLRARSPVPVRHWIEAVDEATSPATRALPQASPPDQVAPAL